MAKSGADSAAAGGRRTRPRLPRSPGAPEQTRAGRRTVGRRILYSYGVVLLAFLATVGSTALSLRAAASDAELLRAGYVPLSLRIGEALAEQNVFNAQLNHVTASKTPADVRDWLEAARRTRPIGLAHVREAAEQLGVVAREPSVRELSVELAAEAAGLERGAASEADRFGALWRAVSSGDRDSAERARSDLVRREVESAAKLRSMRTRIDERMEVVIRIAKVREARGLQLSVGLGVITLLVGALVSLYARRVLAPLARVTARANAVAKGDLTPRQALATDDEIGELAENFEAMVAAIRKARAELVQAERLAAIGKMAAHVTHEIRNPLSSIGLNAELLEDEIAQLASAAQDAGAGHAAEEARALLGAIRKELEHLSRLTEQYLSVARRREPRLETEDLHELTLGLVEFLRPELDQAGVRLELHAEAVPPVRADEVQIRQALQNLIRNAREAAPRGGEVIVTLQSTGSEVELLVEDDGPGVPDDLRASIFEPFFTTKERGTGLGLAVTREVVEAHGGTLTCEPREPRGTRFRIRLPAPAEQR